MTEQDIQRDILDYLKARGVVAWKNHIDRRRYSVGKNGAPDIVGYLPGGRFLGIEVKKPGGNVRPAQDEFIERAVVSGACAFIAYSLDDAREIVEQEMRRCRQ